MEYIIVSLYSYFSGATPFGLILTKVFFQKDVRKIGSGNIGATNVLRTGNKFLAFNTLILDIFKGFLPILITKIYFPELIQLSCILALLGHVFPIWLKFKGGKGVATYLGILFALSYGLGFLFIFTWAVVFLIFRYSSVASLFSTLTIFVVTLIKDTALQTINPDQFNSVIDIKFLLFIFLILILFTHKKNISNLKNKTERKIKL